jgi:hypothetical protein
MERPRGAGPARVDADIIADGRPREASIRFGWCATAARRRHRGNLSAARAAVGPRQSVTLGPRFCEVEAATGASGSRTAIWRGTKTFRVEAYQIDKEWRNKLTLREIAAIRLRRRHVYQSRPVERRHDAAAAGHRGTGWRGLDAFSDDARQRGRERSCPVITGAATDDPNAEAIKVEYWQSDGITDPTVDPDSVPWTTVGTYPPDVTTIQLPTPAGGADYYAAISYVVSGQQGERLVLGPVTAGDLNISPQLRLTIDVVTGTSYTIAADDAWHHKRFTDGSLVTVTVPTNATAAYPIGGRTRLTQVGGGQIEFAPEDGTVTLNSRDGALRSTAQFAVFEIEKVDTNEWDVLGDVTT